MATLLITPPRRRAIIYPDSDGKPMADNTKQFNWITLIKEGLEAVFDQDPRVFVAGNLLWYPVEGQPAIRNAPDVLVALDRPKGDRGSYKQWEEGGQPPQVVMEILSPGNRAGEMQKKFAFYQRYGAEEYYVYDPDHNTLEGWERRDGAFAEISDVARWTSPRLGIRFELGEETLFIYRPDGGRFTTYAEMVHVALAATLRANQAEQRADQEEARADQAQQRAEQQQQRAEQERQRAEQQQQRAELLAQRLRALGIDPDNP